MLNKLKLAKKHIEKLYLDTCNVIERQSIKDPETCQTRLQEVIVHENIPCKLSHKSTNSSGDGVASGLILSTKLIIQPDLVIRAGSKIEVTRNGVTTAYKNSGEPARHFNHQEVDLKIFEDWA